MKFIRFASFAVTLIMLNCGGGIQESRFVHKGAELFIKTVGAHRQQVHQAQQVFARRMDYLDLKTGQLAELNEKRILDNAPNDLIFFLKSLDSLARLTKMAYNPYLGKQRRMFTAGAKMSEGVTLPPFADDKSGIVFDADGGTRLDVMSEEIQIDPGSAGLAWAVDGAADFLIENGVPAGKVSAGGSIRVWGQTIAEDRWRWQVPGVGKEDSLMWFIEPGNGGMSIVTSDDAEIYRYIPLSAEWPPELHNQPDSLLAVVVWSSDAVSASSFAETMFRLGLRAGRGWADGRRFEWMFIVRNDLGSIAECSDQMAGWVSQQSTQQ